MIGGKETILTRLVVPPVVNEVATRFGAVRFNDTAMTELEIPKLLTVGWATPSNNVALVRPAGLLERVKAPDLPDTSNVAPLRTWMKELVGIAPNPLNASTPLLTTVLPL